ncbi:(2E,6E)-farnesyl diphosphate synthase [Candidatus Nitrosacidococcus sp. I8]|uniref:(2E,6E)-farnesyl diphosphate synthase n=1 Tax=Candidatus Nitrosacidococcus sp. I8 TaxID=2942908 RepID=UPI002227BE30|nr:farnesyl diphosphate synthase [Candidatus Nitrosacidococcus sp. I8]CAH9017494.1 Farnesyl diphosphate synthase [Candidatus Nitrosacidococcus sp. I8]
MQHIKEKMKVFQERSAHALDQILPLVEILPNRLHEAMRYAVLGKGKKIRPLLVYSAGAIFGVPEEILDTPACAVELIHTYSLVHDDLPSMDNDDLRRGQPTCHKMFDEATALLVGDSLQTLAFQVLANPSLAVPSDHQIRMIELLSIASGSLGMAGGQAVDLESVGKQLTLSELETIHTLKTGALIRASVLLGAWCYPKIDTSTLEKLDQFALRIGLAFQIQDDVLDVESDTDTLGKPQGSDIAKDKPTYPALLGLDQAKQKAQILLHEAIEILKSIGGTTGYLEWLARFIVTRNY